MKKLILMLFFLALFPWQCGPREIMNIRRWKRRLLIIRIGPSTISLIIKPTELRSLMTGKKLVMVLYFAPWCPNWRNEAPVAASLYDK